MSVAWVRFMDQFMESVSLYMLQCFHRRELKLQTVDLGPCCRLDDNLERLKAQRDR